MRCTSFWVATIVDGDHGIVRAADEELRSVMAEVHAARAGAGLEARGPPVLAVQHRDGAALLVADEDEAGVLGDRIPACEQSRDKSQAAIVANREDTSRVLVTPWLAPFAGRFERPSCYKTARMKTTHGSQHQTLRPLMAIGGFVRSPSCDARG